MSRITIDLRRYARKHDHCDASEDEEDQYRSQIQFRSIIPGEFSISGDPRTPDESDLEQDLNHTNVIVVSRGSADNEQGS